MVSHGLPWVLGLLLATGVAEGAPVCHLKGQPWLEGRVRGPGQGQGKKTARAVDARLGEEIEVLVFAPGSLDGKKVLFSDEPGGGRVSWTAAGCGPLQVSYSRVEPRMEHTSTPAPNRDIKVYANAVVFGPSHGKWIGYDRIEYFETPLYGESAATLSTTVRDARPSEGAVAARDAAVLPLGTMRLKATLRADGQVLSTRGAEDAPSGLISDRVFRYTFRRGDGFLGWLTSFFNVPYLFGSAGQGARSQPEQYLGADCADVLVAALRRAGRRDLDYTSVSGLVSSMKRVGDPVLVRPCGPARGSAGCSPRSEPPLRVGTDVRPGDLLALDYVGAESLPRDWDHIGVFVEDRGPDGRPDGVLGPDDLFADSGDALGLKFAPLAEQGAVRVQVLRPSGVSP